MTTRHCEQCNIEVNKKHWTRHLRTSAHRPEGETGEEVRCEVCEVSFPYRHLWKEHLKTKRHLENSGVSSDALMKECEVCKTSVVKMYFKKHLNSAKHKENVEGVRVERVEGGETKENGHTKHCDICNKDYHKKSFDRHMKIHEAPEEHRCEVCDKTFGYIELLRQHERTPLHLRNSGAEVSAPMKHCDCCDKDITRRKWSDHIKTKGHIANKLNGSAETTTETSA